MFRGYEPQMHSLMPWVPGFQVFEIVELSPEPPKPLNYGIYLKLLYRFPYMISGIFLN